MLDEDGVRFASMLCSRLCHDLVGPVGALGNGLEVLRDEDDPEMQGEALELLALSAEQAAARLKFYRLAFGASGGDDASISAAEARSAAQGLWRGSRVSLDWDETIGSTELSKIAMRAFLNAALVAAEAMPRGGVLRLAAGPTGGGEGLVISARGEGARLADGPRRALHAAGELDTDSFDAKSLPAYLAASLSGAAGARLNCREAGDLVEIELALPTA